MVDSWHPLSIPPRSLAWLHGKVGGVEDVEAEQKWVEKYVCIIYIYIFSSLWKHEVLLNLLHLNKCALKKRAT